MSGVDDVGSSAPQQAPAAASDGSPIGPDIPPKLLWWVGTQALLAPPIEQVFSGFMDALIDAGMPIMRANLSPSLLHPEFKSISMVRYRDGPVTSDSYTHDSDKTSLAWQQSPHRVLLDGAMARSWPGGAEGPPSVHNARYRLSAGEGLALFPVLREIRDHGGTDYIAYAVPFAWGANLDRERPAGMLTSWTTDRPGGFRDEEIALLNAVQPLWGAAVRASVYTLIAEGIMATYLGHDAGRRVLRGDVQRGQAISMAAAIMVADLRGFTTLADSVPPETLLRILDEHLDAMADSVLGHGGQVLKYMGDGLLATFDEAEFGREEACARALAAAERAQARNRAMARAHAAFGHPTMALDIALHHGRVMYGNVGTPRRLDFTIIGPAVNLVSRIESLCQPLGQPVLASAAFAGHHGQPDRFVSVGQHQVRGLAKAQELFALQHSEPSGASTGQGGT